jgi:hypothetical protein
LGQLDLLRGKQVGQVAHLGQTSQVAQTGQIVGKFVDKSILYYILILDF